MACTFSVKTREAYALSLLEGAKKDAAAKHFASCDECKALIVERRRKMDSFGDALIREQRRFLELNRAARRKVVTRGAYAIIAIVLFGVLLQFGLHSRPKRMLSTTVVVRSGSRGERAVKRGRAAAISGAADYATGSALHNEGGDDRERAAGEAASVPAMVGPLLNLYLVNPVVDRSIYRELGVADNIAGLLL